MDLIERDWLPRSAFREDTLQSVLADVLVTWSQRWIVRRTMYVSKVRSATKHQTGQAIRVSGTVASAEILGRGKRALLEFALDQEFSGLTLTEADHIVLDSFVRRGLEDLVGSIDALLGREVTASDGDELEVVLSVEAHEVASVTIPAHILVPVVRSKAEPRSTPSQALRSRMDAVRAVDLKAEGVLGHAELSLDDLRELAVGDIIVLERDLKDKVDLFLAAGGGRIASGKLNRTGRRFCIQL